MTATFLAWYGAFQLVWLGVFFNSEWWWSLLPTEMLGVTALVLMAVVGFDLREERIAARRFARWRERNVK